MQDVYSYTQVYLEERVLGGGLLDFIGKGWIADTLLDLHKVWLQNLVLLPSHRLIVKFVPPHEINLHKISQSRLYL